MAEKWSKTKKILEEDLLCACLRGRVSYFLTHYHNAPDNYGRFCVRVDGKEYVHANPYNENAIFAESNALQKQLGIPSRQWEHGGYLYDTENRAIEAIAEKNAMINDKMDMWQVMQAIDIYRKQDISLSLTSDNEVVRMFAVLDRRTGRRSLEKLLTQLDSQPGWLRFFYLLRLKAEGLTGEEATA